MSESDTGLGHPGAAFNWRGDAVSEHEASPPVPPEEKTLPTTAHEPASAQRLRAMATVRWLLLLAVTSLAFYTVWRFWGPSSHRSNNSRADLYYCPMHPQIRSADPGECPICHMSLELIPAERQQPTPGSSVATPAAASDAAVTASPPIDAGSVSELVPITLALDRQQAIGVTTALVIETRIAEALRAPGVVEVPENATTQVHVRAAGYLERTAVRQTGVRVARGQVLAWLFSPQVYQTQLEFLRAHRWAVEAPAVDGGQAGVAALLGAPGGAQQIERAARHGLELLGIDPQDIDAIGRAGEPMRAVPVRAPASGFVMRFGAVPGAYVAPEMTLYEIADLSRVWVVASLYERDLPRVRQGNAARLVFPSVAAPLQGRVVLVEPDISTTTRTARVRVEVMNPGTTLRPGQYGDVFLEPSPSAVLGVSRDAVVDTGAQRYVFVDLGDGRFSPRAVRVGALIGETYEVLAGLRAGERVVVRGNFMLDSESRLQASLSAAPVGDAGAPR